MKKLLTLFGATLLSFGTVATTVACNGDLIKKTIEDLKQENIQLKITLEEAKKEIKEIDDYLKLISKVIDENDEKVTKNKGIVEEITDWWKEIWKSNK